MILINFYYLDYQHSNIKLCQLFKTFTGFINIKIYSIKSCIKNFPSCNCLKWSGYRNYHSCKYKIWLYRHNQDISISLSEIKDTYPVLIPDISDDFQAIHVCIWTCCLRDVYQSVFYECFYRETDHNQNSNPSLLWHSSKFWFCNPTCSFSTALYLKHSRSMFCWMTDRLRSILHMVPASQFSCL